MGKKQKLLRCFAPLVSSVATLAPFIFGIAISKLHNLEVVFFIPVLAMCACAHVRVRAHTLFSECKQILVPRATFLRQSSVEYTIGHNAVRSSIVSPIPMAASSFSADVLNLVVKSDCFSSMEMLIST